MMRSKAPRTEKSPPTAMCVTPPQRKANQPAMTKLFSLSLIAAATLSGCAATGPKDPAAKPGVTTLDVRRTAASTKALDEIAASYLRLSLAIGTHEPGYSDASYAPPQLKNAAEAAPRDKPALLAATDRKSTR